MRTKKCTGRISDTAWALNRKAKFTAHEEVGVMKECRLFLARTLEKQGE
jgi:hypothetical protein